MFKHTALIDGAKFTRASANRIYTHCIVIKVLIATERAETETRERVALENRFKYHQEVLAGQHKTNRMHLHHLNRVFHSHDQSGRGLTLEQKYAESDAQADREDIKRLAEAQEYVKVSVADRLAIRMAEYDAMIANSEQISTDRLYHYLGGSEWCGRPDLAAKAVAKWQGRGENAIAVEATYTESKPRRS
jgi:hypothetical protein